MIRSDVLVIGAGLSGLMAAYVSAKGGKRVTLLTYGEGTLTVNSGVIDFLGYDSAHRRVLNPKEVIGRLSAEHPYYKIGSKALGEAADCFKELVSRYGMPYVGSLDKNQMVITAVGTEKPTGLAPKMLAAGEVLPGKKRIVVVRVRGLKDFYGEIMVENLKKTLGEKLIYESIEIETNLADGRDFTTQDVARWLDAPEGRQSFVAQLGTVKKDGSTLIVVPQILGTFGTSAYQELCAELTADLVETTCLPPSVNGMRLQRIFLDELRVLGVDIVGNSKAIRAAFDGKRASAVIAKTVSNERLYYADKFILATGGFYSGGITMRDFEQPKEMVFGLPVAFTAGEKNWSNAELFSDRPQGFAKAGIRVDDSLRPADSAGAALFENIYVVGRNLAGYDFCFEHSGNGVAIGSAYKAACM